MHRAENDKNPFAYFLDGFRQYAIFAGRARRKAFWSFTLIALVINVLLVYMDLALGLFSEARGVGVLSGLFMLATLVPSLAITVRRLHDIGRSGWWVLLGFIPFVNLALLIMLVFDSAEEDNEYGPYPKAVEEV